MTNEYAATRVANPSSFYKKPMDVLRDHKLGRDDKHKVLESMKLDSELLAEATSENMSGGERPNLRQIELAIRELKSSNNRETPISGSFDRIVVALPTDDDRAIALAQKGLAFAQAQKAKIRFVSVFPPVASTIAPPDAFATAELAAALSYDAKDAFAARRSGVVETMILAQAPNVEACQIVRQGAPPEEIVNEASDWKADLIIVGARERNWLERLFDQSVSGAVARHAECAVLIFQASDVSAPSGSLA